MSGMEALTAWIQPQHLSTTGIDAHRAAFESHTAQVLHMTDFLKADVATKIARFLSQEANYEPIYALYSAKGHVVSAETWQAADEKDRFFTYGMLGDIDPRLRLSPNLLTYIRLRQTLATSAFKAYVSAVTGLPLGDMTPTKVHQMQVGHYLRPHNDTGGRRRLAFIFYLSPTWKADYGGALHIIENNGQCTKIEVTFNSLVVFDVTKHKEHYVADIQATAGNQSRMTIGGWFRNPPQA